MIHSQGGEFWLVDLGSRNGTHVGERRIYQPVRLRDGDRIRISSQTFVFHQSGSASQETLNSSAYMTRTEISAVPCWLLVADIQGSTVMAQSMPQDQLAMLLGRWFQSCRTTIEKNGGSINKYLGDGFLAYWRNREPDFNGMVEALKSLRKMQLEALPPFRLVLHTGEVLFNSAISPNEENLSGASMSFVFRMEKLAGTLGVPILVSDAARQHLKEMLAFETAGEHMMAGFDGKFPFFTVTT